MVSFCMILLTVWCLNHQIGGRIYQGFPPPKSWWCGTMIGLLTATCEPTGVVSCDLKWEYLRTKKNDMGQVFFDFISVSKKLVHWPSTALDHLRNVSFSHQQIGFSWPVELEKRGVVLCSYDAVVCIGAKRNPSTFWSITRKAGQPRF